MCLRKINYSLFPSSHFIHTTTPTPTQDIHKHLLIFFLNTYVLSRNYIVRRIYLHGVDPHLAPTYLLYLKETVHLSNLYNSSILTITLYFLTYISVTSVKALEKVCGEHACMCDLQPSLKILKQMNKNSIDTDFLPF